MNNVKFIKPVYPGNTLYVIAEITNKKSIKRKWTRYSVTFNIQ